MTSVISRIIGSGVSDVIDSVGDALNKPAEIRANLEMAAIDSETKLALSQNDVNKVEAAHPDLFISGWRAGAGWICVGGLFYQTMFCPIFGWIMSNMLKWTMPPPLDTETLVSLLFGLLGLGGYRSIEKIRGVK